MTEKMDHALEQMRREMKEELEDHPETVFQVTFLGHYGGRRGMVFFRGRQGVITTHNSGISPTYPGWDRIMDARDMITMGRVGQAIEDLWRGASAVQTITVTVGAKTHTYHVAKEES